jgi:hypothetical protein
MVPLLPVGFEFGAPKLNQTLNHGADFDFEGTTKSLR